MANTTQSKKGENTGSKSTEGGNSREESGFGLGSGNTGVLMGAALAGAAVGIAANVGRKLFVQFTSGATGDWFDALKTEHRLTLGIFDKIEATRDDQGILRGQLLMKLKYALTKHAHEEESIIYPALRPISRFSRAARGNA